jgi:hypothetical protein
MHEMHVPRRLFGWKSLQQFLDGLGIHLTVDALECRGRRHGLPHDGGMIRGLEVTFTGEQLEVWARHFTGRSLEALLAELEAGGLEPRVLKRVAVRPAALLPIPTLYVVTKVASRDGEEPLRLPSGLVAARLGEAPLQPFLQDFSDDMRTWWYQRARVATHSDLLQAKQRRGPRRAGALVGALRRTGKALSMERVPGEWFGLPPCTTTHFLCTRHWAGFEARIQAFQKDPDVVLAAWSHRALLDPITFEQLPSDGDYMTDLLRLE